MLQPPHDKVRVLIADDHQLVRIALRCVLSDHPRISVIDEASSGNEALDRVQQNPPDVVLLDIRMPDLDGLQVCRQLKSANPKVAVIFLSSFDDDQTILSAATAGADGYLLKSAASHNIAEAVLAVSSGGSAYDPHITRRLLSSAQEKARGQFGWSSKNLIKQLTAQELRVLEHLANGRSNKEIASHLNLSEGTVRNYLSVVFSKLGVKSRVEAALLFRDTQAAKDPSAPPFLHRPH